MTTRNQNRDETKPKGWRVEGMPDEKPATTPPGGPRKFFSNNRILLLAVILLAANWYLSTLIFQDQKVAVSYTAFLDQLESGNVEAVFSRGEAIEGRFKEAVASPDDPGR